MHGGSIYRSDDGERRVKQQYGDAVDALDADFEDRWIRTRHGKTHLLVTGPEDAPPLLLFHGGNALNPLTLEWFLPLAAQYRIYAPDTVGHPGLSAQTRLSPHDESYGTWVVDLLDELGLDAVPMIGVSYGGGILLRTAAVAPERITAAALVAPAGLSAGGSLGLLFEMGPSMIAYRLYPNDRLLRSALQPLFTDPIGAIDARVFDQLAAVFRHVDLEIGFPRPTTAADLEAFTAPTLLIAAEDDPLFPPEQLCSRARAVIPSLREPIVLSGESHLPSAAGQRRIRDEIEAFLASVQSAG
ncbi:alpha/beta fold hydrolase [Haloferacaceae archaeon DSL9]